MHSTHWRSLNLKNSSFQKPKYNAYKYASVKCVIPTIRIIYLFFLCRCFRSNWNRPITTTIDFIPNTLNVYYIMHYILYIVILTSIWIFRKYTSFKRYTYKYSRYMCYKLNWILFFPLHIYIQYTYIHYTGRFSNQFKRILEEEFIIEYKIQLDVI